MKKSDKILLGGFAAALLLLTSIHLSLYASYKSGKRSVYNAENELPAADMHLIPNVLFVTMHNVADVRVRFGDTAKIEKVENNQLSWVQNKDTLIITGKGLRGTEVGLPDIQLPYNVHLSLFNSAIYIGGSRKPAANNPTINLKKSVIAFSGIEVPLVFDSVRIVAADSSNIAFRGNTQASRLDLQLSQSQFAYMDGNPGRLSITADSASVLSLSAKHLSTANIQLLPKE